MQHKLDPAVRLAAFVGAIVGNRGGFAIAHRRHSGDVDPAPLQRQQNRLGPCLRQGLVATFRALRIRVTADLHLDWRAGDKDPGQFVQHGPCGCGDLGGSRGEGNLGPVDDGVHFRHTFLRRGKCCGRIQRFIIADVDLEGLALTKFARQNLRDAPARAKRTGNARHFDRIGPHQKRALIHLGQGFKSGQHPDGPAVWQGCIHAGRRQHFGPGKGRAGEGIDSPALHFVGQAAAQLYPARLCQGRGKLGRTLCRGFGLFKRGGQGKGVGQAGFQFAHHLVKGGLRDIAARKKRHVAVRKCDRG